MKPRNRRIVSAIALGCWCWVGYRQYTGAALQPEAAAFNAWLGMTTMICVVVAAADHFFAWVYAPSTPVEHDR